jgi:ribosomal protein S18 acetylase RimI-like enzyme
LGHPSRKDLELNEVRWWSSWARLAWFGPNGYLLASDDFREPFFNRAGTLACTEVTGTAGWAEKKFATRGLDSTLTVFDTCNRAGGELENRGYRPIDTMTVLLADRPVATEASPQTAIVPSRSTDGWTRAYLEAFYGDQELAVVVTPIVSRLLKARTVTLLEAKIHSETAGVLAIYRTKGLAGVYCVGTVPECRRLGVAGMLLHRAKEIAKDEGRVLILQSLASDGSEGFYRKRGFVPLYSKRMLTKESSNAIKKERN